MQKDTQEDSLNEYIFPFKIYICKRTQICKANKVILGFIS